MARLHRWFVIKWKLRYFRSMVHKPFYTHTLNFARVFSLSEARFYIKHLHVTGYIVEITFVEGRRTQ